MAGYSTRPLIEKLGIRSGMRALIVWAPRGYRRTLGRLPDGALVRPGGTGQFNFVQIFAETAADLTVKFRSAKRRLRKDGMLWTAWPKKSSATASDLDENVVRVIGLGLGLVDVKVCAFDETWSGLKFVYRVKDRK